MPRRTEPDTLSLAVGRRIRALREEAGLTLEQVARGLDGGSKGHLSSMERGLVRPTVHTLAALAERLGCLLQDLLTFPDQE